MKKKIGKVTEDECEEILSIFERRNGLTELAKILSADNNELYERLVADLSSNASKFNEWWERMKQKYNFESVENGRWEIDFNDCLIYLVTPE